MSWRELRNYIEGLHRAGFDVSTLTVQWHEKIAFPLLAPVSMLLAIPLRFWWERAVRWEEWLSGWDSESCIGRWPGSWKPWAGLGSFLRFLAGWSPDIIFFFMGMYFFFKMPT